jgi:hypothetical protein
MSAQNVFKRGRAATWSLERIGELSVRDIKQLRENAERLDERSLAALCSQALKDAHPRSEARLRGRAVPRAKAGRLIPRTRAFEARGVFLQDARTSWGGVRKSDGMVVMALWADAIESADGGCSYLLWAPNVGGSRPWSDEAAGKERLEHCKRAAAQGSAEGLLVHGERLVGHIPEHKAYAVYGVDREVVLVFKIEMRGPEFWATWGKRA